MLRRHLNIYFVPEENQLSLHFVEIFNGSNHQNFRRTWEDAHNNLNYYYLSFISTSMCRDNIYTSTILKHERNGYVYNEMIVPLQASTEFLLKQIGPLDGALHYYKKYHNEESCNVNFLQELPDFSDKERILTSTLMAEGKLSKLPETMTRTVARWIVSKFEQRPEALQAYRDAIPELKKLLATEVQSLTYAIRHQYYPVPTFNQPIVQQLIDSNPLLQTIYDPELNYPQKEEAILQWVRDQLNPASQLPPTFFFGNQKKTDGNVTQGQQIDREEIMERKLKSMGFDLVRQSVWIQRVETLVGQTAFDGGPYLGGTPLNQSNPEFRLLARSNMYLNDDGLMTLDYRKCFMIDDAYNFDEDDNGRTIMQKRDFFEAEMRHAAKLLGLSFSPDQDFYKNRVVTFTPESTRKLMDWGLHITKDYCHQIAKTVGLISNPVESPVADADIQEKKRRNP